MSDEDEEAEPSVELGEHTPVEGAPLARATARLHWPIQASEIDRLQGDSVIRTPEGARELSTVLDEVDETYFGRRQEFERHVRDVVGTGPVRTAEGGTESPDATGDPGENGGADATESPGADSESA